MQSRIFGNFFPLEIFQNFFIHCKILVEDICAWLLEHEKPNIFAALPSSAVALFSRYVSSHFYDSDDEDPGKKTAAEICWFVKIGLESGPKESQRFIDALETKMKKTWLQCYQKASAPALFPPFFSSTGPNQSSAN